MAWGRNTCGNWGKLDNIQSTWFFIILFCFSYLCMHSGLTHLIFSFSSQRSYTICARWLLLLLMRSFCLDLYQKHPSMISFSLSHSYFCLMCSIMKLFHFCLMQEKCLYKIYSKNRCDAPNSYRDKAPSFVSWLAAYQAPYYRHFQKDPFAVSSEWICEY